MSSELGTIDAGGDGKDVLLRVINTIYGKNFTLDDFDFGKPEFVVTPNPTHNSYVKLGPKAHTGYYGFRTVYYNRIHVSELGTIKVPYAGEQFLTQVLPKINVKYGILIKPEDVYEQIIAPPATPGADIILDLQFRPESLVFYGGDRIIIGTNDPSIEFDSPINLPFANETVFFVHSTYPAGGQLYTEYSSVALSSDYIRQRSARIYSDADDLFTRGAKAKLTEDQYAKLKNVLPFVSTWTVNDGKAIRGLNIFGDVLELDAGGEKWTFISNALGLSGSVPEATLTALKNRPVFKRGVQTTNGDLYVLKRDDVGNAVEVIKSTDNGLTWTTNPLTPGDEQFSRYSLWDDTKITDMVAVSTKIYMLVWGVEPYSNGPTTDMLPPAVEEFNTITGESKFYPIGDRKIRGLEYGLVLDHGIIKFVNSNNNDGTPPDLVALFSTEVTKTPVALYYQLGAQTYDGMIIPKTDLEPEALRNGYYDITGYKQKLVKSANYMLAVDIISRIDSNEIDFELFMNSNERTENGFFNHGVETFATVIGAAGISKWSATTSKLGYGTTPKFLTVDHKGLRSSYILQGEVGLFRSKFNESSTGYFTPTFEHLFKSGAQTGYNLHSLTAGGQHVPIKVMEYVTGTNTLTAIHNTEEDKNLISYSFITKKDTGEHGWYVADAINKPLVARTFDPLYGHMGKIPLAVASMEGNIFVWSQNGRTIHVSEVGGKIWKPYASTLTYYIDGHEKFDGTANLALKPEFFKSASLKNNKLIFEIGYSNSFQVINPETRELNEVIEVKDTVLYEVDAADPRDEAIQFNSVYSARGMNVLSNFSPRKLLAWDTDTDNGVLALANYSSSRDTPFTESVNMDQVNADVIADPDFKIVIADYDLVYIGLKHVAIVKNDSNFFKMYAVKEDDTVVVSDMSDSGDALYNFTPRVSTHLWDYTDDVDLYTPYIVLGAKEVILFERVDVDGNYSVTRHALTIPNNNSADLQIIPMLNDNRRDILVYQKGNGIFKFNYTWDNIERVSTVGLTKIFNLAAISDIDFITGCYVDSTPVEPYGEVKVPVIPPRGTLLDTVCRGVNKVGIYADGKLGKYETVIETNSVDCGYIPPVPGVVEDGGANVNTGG